MKNSDHSSHLVRYFLLFAVIAFAGYIKNLHEIAFIALLGPCLYIAQAVRGFFTSTIYELPLTDNVKFYGFLLPVTLLYFGAIGHQIKNLWSERNSARFLILILFVGFLVYVHLTALKDIQIYLQADLTT